MEQGEKNLDRRRRNNENLLLLLLPPNVRTEVAKENSFLLPLLHVALFKPPPFSHSIFEKLRNALFRILIKEKKIGGKGKTLQLPSHSMREFPGNSYFFVWGPRCMHAIGAFTKRISRVRLHDTTSARQKVFFLHLPASSDQTVFCPSSPFDSNCHRRGKCLRFFPIFMWEWSTQISSNFLA